jgi:hypothetical protein
MGGVLAEEGSLATVIIAQGERGRFKHGYVMRGTSNGSVPPQLAGLACHMMASSRTMTSKRKSLLGSCPFPPFPEMRGEARGCQHVNTHSEQQIVQRQRVGV